MVVNLCLPSFHTRIHCNKVHENGQRRVVLGKIFFIHLRAQKRRWSMEKAELCADGYDVSNLVSADPAVRRQGFKLEYFLRPPLQVTLTFDFKVEICRVDVELWPWGMDRGQAFKKLEISTCSNYSPSIHCDQSSQKKSVKEKDCAEATTSEAQSSTCYSNCGSTSSEFKLVGRCELREETKVCFSHSNFRPRPPFHHPPPSPPTNCHQEALWSRGVPSLSAVTQLRVAVPFGGAASALGLKALSVWGQPARGCPAEQVEQIQKAHEASEVQTTSRLSVSHVCPPKSTKKAPTTHSFSVPEEFLDPITQEVMVLPMLLPSGVSVDQSTLDEYQKREATWGRAPNDPFTGVLFSASSRPLPHPQLKNRIDHFLLQSGQFCKEGRLGRQAEGTNLQPSRLVASEAVTNKPQTLMCALNREQVTKRDFTVYSDNTTEEDGQRQQPQAKRPTNDRVQEAPCSSHEQRLSASLDEALSSALQGRPSFTSNLSVETGLGTHSSQLKQDRQTEGTSSTGETSCSNCSCSFSAYTTPYFLIYRLRCGHFLCRSCLPKPSEPLNPHASPDPGYVSCPICQRTTQRSDVVRVHH